MRKILKVILPVLLASTLITACSDDDSSSAVNVCNDPIVGKWTISGDSPIDTIELTPSYYYIVTEKVKSRAASGNVKAGTFTIPGIGSIKLPGYGTLTSVTTTTDNTASFTLQKENDTNTYSCTGEKQDPVDTSDTTELLTAHSWHWDKMIETDGSTPDFTWDYVVTFSSAGTYLIKFQFDKTDTNTIQYSNGTWEWEDTTRKVIIWTNISDPSSGSTSVVELSTSQFNLTNNTDGSYNFMSPYVEKQ